MVTKTQLQHWCVKTVVILVTVMTVVTVVSEIFRVKFSE